MPVSLNRTGRYLLTVGAIALVYILTAKLAISTLDLSKEVVKASPLWPPAGVAVAALLLLGTRMWVGIAIGSFLFALTLMMKSDPVLPAMGIALGAAAGSSLQAICAVYLLKRVDFRPSLARLKDALGFVVMAAIASPAISATINTFVPYFLGKLTPRDLGYNWWTTWLGDGMGVLILTPALLTCNSWCPFMRRQRHLPEFLLWVGLLVGTSVLVFGVEPTAKSAHYPLEYLPFPLLVWAALRFGQRGAVFASLMVSLIAILGTALGRGPFIAESENLQQAVTFLQAFMGVVAITALVLASAVTERQRTEDLLRRNEASLANAQRIARVGNWDLDLFWNDAGVPVKGDCLASLRWSDELYRILGIEPQSIAPNQELFLQAVHPDDRERVQQAFDQAILDRKPFTLEYRLLLPSHGERIVIEQVEVRETGISGTVQDVTEQRRAEVALRESDRRCRGMFEGAAIGIGMDSLDGRVLESNPALQSMLGYTQEELSQMTFSQFTHPDDIARDEGLFQEMIAGIRDHYQMEKRHVRKDGQVVWVRLTNSLIRDATGNPHFTIGMVEDITELKRAEERIRLYADIVNNMQIGVIVWRLKDLDDPHSFYLVDLNPAAARILKLQGNGKTLLGKSMQTLFPALAATDYPQHYVDVIRHQTVMDLGEIRYVDDAILEGIFSTKAFPLPNQCVGLTFEDVSERKRAEEALQQSEARFRVVAETAACAILVYQGTRFRYVNPAAEAITGYSREELIAMNFWATVHPDFREIVRQRGLARQRGEWVPPRYELKIITKTGEERWLDYTAAPVFFEGEPAALGTAFDITERKQAEAQLQLTAQRDRLLNEIAQRIRQSLDLKEILNTTVAEIRQFLQADRVFINYLEEGKPSQVVAESVASPWRSLLGFSVDPEASAEARSLFMDQRILINNDSSQMTLPPLLEPYHAYCQIKAGIGVALTRGGQVFGMLGVNQCSAPRHWQPFEVELLEQLAVQVEIAIQQGQLYHQVQSFASSLECQVAERTTQLQQKMQELQELNQTQEILLHAVSHDLRTPIMGTQMLLKTLQNRSVDPISLPRAVLERMIQSGDRQLDLIHSLLEDHNQEGKGISLNCEPLQLSTLIARVLDELDPLVQANQATLTQAIPPDLPPVMADPLQLRRVFDNLITNALKHNHPGIHISVRATLEPSPCPSQNTPGWIRCTVEDNGIGISEEQCSRLFKLYIRGLYNQRLTGIGLGLYICRQIVTAHGGTVGVDSGPGQGAAFWFTLPLANSQVLG